MTDWESASVRTISLVGSGLLGVAGLEPTVFKAEASLAFGPYTQVCQSAHLSTYPDDPWHKAIRLTSESDIGCVV